MVELRKMRLQLKASLLHYGLLWLLVSIIHNGCQMLPAYGQDFDSIEAIRQMHGHLGASSPCWNSLGHLLEKRHEALRTVLKDHLELNQIVALCDRCR